MRHAGGIPPNVSFSLLAPPWGHQGFFLAVADSLDYGVDEWPMCSRLYRFAAKIRAKETLSESLRSRAI